MNSTCFGLMRAFGMLAFMMACAGSLYAGNKLFGLGLDLSNLFVTDMKGSAIALCIGSGLVGLVGLLIGQGIGASIPVRSRKKCFAFCLLWHTGANASIVWIALSVGSIGLQFGRDAAREWLRSFGTWRYALVLAAIAVVTGWLVGVAHFVIGCHLADRGKDASSALVPWLLAFGAGVTAGIVQAVTTGTGVWAGAVTGLLLPVFVVPLTNWTLQRDELLRERLQRAEGGTVR